MGRRRLLNNFGSLFAWGKAGRTYAEYYIFFSYAFYIFLLPYGLGPERLSLVGKAYHIFCDIAVSVRKPFFFEPRYI